MRKSQGFTLIELMVTIAVLAIVAMMAAPSFVNQIRKNQLNTAANEIISLASQTRSEAILRKKDKTLSLAVGITGADDAWAPSEHVEWVTSPPPLLKYNYFGNLVGANQCFILKHAKNDSLKAIIRFNASGSVVYNKNQTTC